MLNKTKLQKALALNLLHAKSDGFRLNEFEKALKNSYEFGIP